MTEAIRKLIEDNRWRPIEEAPKDKEILALCNDTKECFVVQWMKSIVDDSEMWVTARAYDEESGQVVIGCRPDKWMPLPDDRLAEVCEALLTSLNNITCYEKEDSAKAAVKLAKHYLEKANEIAKGNGE